MSRTLLLGIGCVALGAAVLAVLLRPEEGPDAPVRDASRSVEVPAPAGDADSPFAVADASAPEVEAAEAGTSIAGESAAIASGEGPVRDVPVDLRSLGHAPMSDERFETLRARLATDPALLDALVQELRGETDATRIERLSSLLGTLDDPAVTALAVELAYSSDPALRAAGLDLLGRVDGADVIERDAVVSGLLSSETDVEVLTSALGALVRPGSVDETSRASMSTQVALLADHEDPEVRRASIGILSRWTRDGTDTPVLLDGLRDPDESVRRSAAYALADHEAVDDGVRRELLRVVRDEAESSATRIGALQGLKRAGAPADVTDEDLSRLERELNRRLRSDLSG